MGLLAGEGAEALLGLGAKVLRELFLGNTLQDIGGEGIAEHQLGFLQGDPSLTHIEECILAELPCGHPVGTLHVVGIDLQLGLGLHASRGREQEVAIVLIGLRLLGILSHKDASGEDTTTLIEEDILEELIRGTVGHCVLDEGEVIGMHTLAGE